MEEDLKVLFGCRGISIIRNNSFNPPSCFLLAEYWEVIDMKKITAIILVLCLAFTLAACSGQTKEKISAEESDDKILVAYFSCTGNTKKVAEDIVNELGADIYEIIPEDPYTDADLDHNNSSSRANLEQNNDTSRPAISESVENMEGYDIVFLGYPIWWGEAPKIISTFLESYDFSDKTIIPFCTSGSVDIGSSATNLHGLASAHWLDGTRFPSNAARQAVAEWIDDLPIEVTE